MFDNSNQLCQMTTKNIGGFDFSRIQYDTARKLIRVVVKRVHYGTKTFQFRDGETSIDIANDLVNVCQNKDILVSCWTQLDHQTIMIADQHSKSALKFKLI